MSLFSEADSLKNESSGLDLVPGRDHRIVWFWRGVFGIAALAAVTGGYYAGHRSSAGEYAAFYQEQKAQVMAGLRDSAAKLRTETAASESADYPFIGKPHIHNFNIRYNEDEFSTSSGDPRKTDARTENRNGFDADEYDEPAPAPTRKKPKSDAATPRTSETVVPEKKSDKKADVRQDSRGENRVETKKLSVQDLFYDAVESTGGMDSFQPEAGRSQKSRDKKMAQEAMPLGSLPDSIKNQVPSFVYNAHNYSTDSARRSVTLNGVSVKEGGRFRNLDVVKIGEDYVVFRVQGQSFSWKAMDDYRQ